MAGLDKGIGEMMLGDIFSCNRVELSREEAEKELRDFLFNHDNVKIRRDFCGIAISGEKLIVVPNLLKEEK